MPDYLPPALDWVREQVELYEKSGGLDALISANDLSVIVIFTGFL